MLEQIISDLSKSIAMKTQENSDNNAQITMGVAESQVSIGPDTRNLGVEVAKETAKQ